MRRVKDDGLFGGVMIPNIAPDSHLEPLHAPIYEPLWALCEELEVPVNMHGGSGMPNLGPYPATPALMFLEFGWYAQRPLLRLMFAGVFERHPDLTFIMTEQGNSWVPGLLAGLDWAVERMRGVPGSVEEKFGGEIARSMSLTPSEYWARQCFLGASFMGPHDCAVREETGIDTIMWGSDYPHSEGTHPYTMEALRYTFADVERSTRSPHARHQRGARVRLRPRRARAPRRPRSVPGRRRGGAARRRRVPDRRARRPRSTACGSPSATSPELVGGDSGLYTERAIRRLRYHGMVVAPRPMTPATTNSHHQLLVVPGAVGALAFWVKATGAAVGVRVTVEPLTSTWVATLSTGAGGGGIERSACWVADGRAVDSRVA